MNNQRLANNLFHVVLLTVLWPVSLFIQSVFIARYLGDHAFGIYSIGSNYFNLFKDLALLGLPVILIKNLPHLEGDESHGYFYACLKIGMVSSVIAAFAMNGLSALYGYDDELQAVIFLFSIMALFDVSLRLFLSAYIVEGRMKAFTLFSTINLTMQLAGTIGLTVWGAALPAILGLQMGIMILNAFLTFHYLVRSIHPGPYRKLTPSRIWSILRETPLFSLITLLEGIVFRVDILLFSSLVSAAVLGYYALAKRFLFFVFLLSLNITNTILATLTRIKGPSPQEFLSKASDLFRVLCFLGFWVGLNLFLFSGILVTLIFGSDYQPSETHLRIMAGVSLPIALSFFLSRLLFIYQKQKVDFLILLTGLFLVFALYREVLERYALIGGAWLFAVVYLVMFMMRWLYVRILEPELFSRTVPVLVKTLLLLLPAGILWYYRLVFGEHVTILLTNVATLLCAFLVGLITIRDLRFFSRNLMQRNGSH